MRHLFTHCFAAAALALTVIACGGTEEPSGPDGSSTTNENRDGHANDNTNDNGSSNTNTNTNANANANTNGNANDTVARATIDATGGTLTSTDGAVALIVPAGALSAATELTVEIAASPPAGADGPVYDFGPDGFTFTERAVLRFARSTTDTRVVATWDGTAWVPMATAWSDASHFYGAVGHFSLFAMVDPNGASCTTDTDCPDTLACYDGTTCLEICTASACAADDTACHLASCFDPCATVICDPAQRCYAGSCYDTCDDTSCPAGTTCFEDNLCREEANLCVGVQCPLGDVCFDGSCYQPCDAGGFCVVGGTCFGEAGCREDPCSGVTCPLGEICEQGRCYDPTACTSDADCNAGEICFDNGRCGADACRGILCPEGQRCDAGSCYDTCDDTSCPAGTTCFSDNLCRDPATLCADVWCPLGQVCYAGSCFAPCDAGGSCLAGGTCFGEAGCREDPCSGVTCPLGEICEQGRCYDPTACTSDADCAEGETCFDNGRCSADACEGILCPLGQVCYGGSCYAACTSLTDCNDPGSFCYAQVCTPSPCENVVCPLGEVCLGGACLTPCLVNADCAAGEQCFADGACRGADVCADVACRSDEQCVSGQCYVTCSGSGDCAADETCFGDGVCRLTADPCAGVVCAPGETCADGVCLARPVAEWDLGVVRFELTPDPVSAGAPLTHRVLVQNFGTSAIPEATIEIRTTGSVSTIGGGGVGCTPVTFSGGAGFDCILTNLAVGEQRFVAADLVALTAGETLSAEVTATITVGGPNNAPGDQVATASASVVPYALPVIASIVLPENGASFELGELIEFEATVEDSLGVDLLEQVSLEWSSSIDGVFSGTEVFSIDALSAGEHVITLTAFDGAEELATDTISLTVVPVGDLALSIGAKGSGASFSSTAIVGERLNLFASMRNAAGSLLEPGATITGAVLTLTVEGSVTFPVLDGEPDLSDYVVCTSTALTDPVATRITCDIPQFSGTGSSVILDFPFIPQSTQPIVAYAELSSPDAIELDAANNYDIEASTIVNAAPTTTANIFFGLGASGGGTLGGPYSAGQMIPMEVTLANPTSIGNDLDQQVTVWVDGPATPGATPTGCTVDTVSATRFLWRCGFLVPGNTVQEIDFPLVTSAPGQLVVMGAVTGEVSDSTPSNNSETEVVVIE